MIIPDRDAECERFVADLLDHMSLVEKAGQLAIRAAPNPDDRAASDQFNADLKEGRIGSVIDLKGEDEAERLQRIAQEESRLGIPLLFPAPVGHGLTTILPSHLATAASWDEGAAAAAEAVVAQEAEALGINWAQSPPFALSRHGDTSITANSLGEQAHLAARIAAARIRGIQGTSDGQKSPLLATLDLTEFFTQPDHAEDPDAASILRIVDAAVTYGRVGSIAIDGVSPERRRLVDKAFHMLVGPGGYDGILLPEWAALAEASSSSEVDIHRTGVSVEALVDAVENQRIPRERLDDAAARVLRAKFRLGLFEAAHSARGPRIAHPLPTPIHNRETALDLARRCPVLLRNDPALLPLGIDSGEVLLVGPAASDRHLALGGSKGIAASVIDGFEQLGIPHRYISGLALRENGSASRDMMAADGMAIGMAGEAARRAGTVVAVLAADERGDFGEAQQNLLSVLSTANRRLVLVNLGPRPVDPRLQGEPITSVLHAGALGSTSGHAIAELLSGEFSPCGKLPLAIPGKRRNGGLPFGYGLSYADFALTNLSVEVGHDRLHFFVNLRNCSEREGSEVVQLYLRREPGIATSPQPELADFKRVSLRPGLIETLVFDVGREQIGSYQSDGSFRVEEGAIEFFIGLSANRGLSTKLEISREFARAIAQTGLHPVKAKSA